MKKNVANHSPTKKLRTSKSKKTKDTTTSSVIQAIFCHSSATLSETLKEDALLNCGQTNIEACMTSNVQVSVEKESFSERDLDHILLSIPKSFPVEENLAANFEFLPKLL